MVDKVTVKRSSSGGYETEMDVALTDIARNQLADAEWVPAGPLLLSPKHQGRCLVFSGASVVTVPANLPEGFSCGFVQAGSGEVSFIAGSGATVNSYANQTKLAGPWAVGAVSSFAPATFLLYGHLVT